MLLNEINTDRIKLRVVTPTDYDTIMTKLSEGEQKHLLGIIDSEELADQHRKFEEGLTTYNRKFVHFFIFDKYTDKNIGWVGYHIWYIDHDRAELGYKLWFDEDKRKGILSEILPSVIDYGFIEMKLHRIEACVGPENVPSLRLMEKLNFTREGLLRGHYKHNGVNEDSIIFSLLRNEYLTN